jgi:hypothetical protein
MSAETTRREITQQDVAQPDVAQQEFAPQETATPSAATQATTAPSTQRPDGITLLAGYHFLLGGLMLLGTCGLAIPTVITGIVGIAEDPEAFIATFILGVIAAIVMMLSLLYLTVGYGLWTQRQWARTASIALGVVSLFGVPIGTLIGGVTIWYLMKEEVAATFV